MEKSLFTRLDQSWLLLDSELPSEGQESELAKLSYVMLDEASRSLCRLQRSLCFEGLESGRIP